MNLLKFWIVTEFYDSPYDTVGGYYVKGLAEKLSSEEYVEVVCPSVNSSAHVDLINGLRINYIHQINHSRRRLIIRSVAQVIISLQFFFFLLGRVKKDDIIVTFTHPTFIIFISSFLKRLKKTKTVIVNYDIFPEILIGTGASKDNCLYRLILRVFDRAYNKADKIISLSYEMTDILKKKIRNNGTKIYTLPNWADIENIYFQTKEKNWILVKYDLVSKIVFSYAGTIGRCQGIDKLSDLIDSIDHDDRIHFLFFGKGVAVNSFLNQIKKNKNRDLITFGGFIVTDDRKDFINACDVAIISLLEDMTGMNFPSKTYNIMASGHPVFFIGKEDCELAKMIKSYDFGWVCSSFDPIKFQQIINEIVDHPAEIIEKGKNAREAAEKHFAKEDILDRYMEVFKQI